MSFHRHCSLSILPHFWPLHPRHFHFFCSPLRDSCKCFPCPPPPLRPPPRFLSPLSAGYCIFALSPPQLIEMRWTFRKLFSIAKSKISYFVPFLRKTNVLEGKCRNFLFCEITNFFVETISPLFAAGERSIPLFPEKVQRQKRIK